ncbi:MAG: hypothetical protein Kow0010_09980 [Dehalococcoidia bacterium]
MDKRIHAAAITVAVALLVGVVGFTVTYALRGSDEVSSAQQPRDTPEDPTPAPSATPDTSRPNWYLPWLQADEAKPRFEGTLGGLRIFASPESAPAEVSALELCPPDGFELVHPHEAIAAAAGAGPLSLEASDFGPGAVFPRLPDVWHCHGTAAVVVWDAELKGGTPGVNPGGAAVAVSRFREQDWIVLGAPRERWEEVTVAGRPAVVKRAVLEEFDVVPVASCAAASWDPVTRVQTQVIAGPARSSVCLEILESVLSD